MRTALTIAGSDPSGGAGLQGDLKTFAAHGVYGMAVVTALTAQNTTGVSGIFDPPPEFVAEQLEAVLYDMPVSAAKTGMLHSPATIEAVASVLRRSKVPNLVVDPVMLATSGDALLQGDGPDAIHILAERLFPLATLITPNLPEAERLTGRRIDSTEALRDAARRLARSGAWAVLITGGHGRGSRVVDLLYCTGEFIEFSGQRIDTAPTHGTGCALAAGIAAQLARGARLDEAVDRARAFVRGGLEHSLALGHGSHPLNHLWERK